MFAVLAAATVSAGESCAPRTPAAKRTRPSASAVAVAACRTSDALHRLHDPRAQSVAAAPAAGAFVVVFSTQTRISPPGIATAVAPSSPDETSAVVFDGLRMVRPLRPDEAEKQQLATARSVRLATQLKAGLRMTEPVRPQHKRAGAPPPPAALAEFAPRGPPQPPHRSKPEADSKVFALRYERVLEGRTYLGELRGATKKKESIFDLALYYAIYVLAENVVLVEY